MTKGRNREQFFARYPGAKEYVGEYKAFKRLAPRCKIDWMIEAGWKDREIFHTVASHHFADAEGDFKKYLVEIVKLSFINPAEVDEDDPTMYRYPRMEILRTAHDCGLKAHEVWSAYRKTDLRMVLWVNILASDTIVSELEAQCKAYWNETGWLISTYHYRNAEERELIEIARSLDRMSAQISPDHLRYRRVGTRIELFDISEMTCRVTRRILRIDDTTRSWASIKRMRKVARRWNQVDGQFIEILRVKLPYHLQDWISPRGDTLEGYTFTPLTTMEALRVEGEEMDHCVRSSVRQCLEHPNRAGSHIYKITGKERATMEIVETTENKKFEFAVAQLYKESNKIVSSELTLISEEFLKLLNKDVNDRFNRKAAHKVRSNFHKKYNKELKEGNKPSRNRWLRAINYLLPYFPELQELLDREEELFNGGQ